MGLPHGIGRRRIIPWLRSSSARHGLLLLRRSLIVGCEHRAAARLAGLGAATGFLVNPLGPPAVSAAALLSLRQRFRLWLGLGLGLGIADGLRQHLA